MRYTMAGPITAVLVAVAGVGVTAPPAHAAGNENPVRVAQPSTHDTVERKSETVTCPGPNRFVFAAGFRIDGAPGEVVPVGMVPDSTLRSVTVTAVARGRDHAWSLWAYAICGTTSEPLLRVPATAYGAASVTATCPGDFRLTGTGFLLRADVDHSYLDEVSFGPGLRHLRVHAAGPGTPASITAFAICKEPDPLDPSLLPVRVAETSESDASWPKSVSAGDPALPEHRISGVGGVVEGGGGQVFLSALVPDLDADLALVQAVRARPLPAGGFAVADLGTEDEDPPEGSVTSEGILIGTFH